MSQGPDRRASLLVAVMWVLMGGLSVSYVIRFGSPDPLNDDLEMAPYFTGARPLSLALLWSLHNEHRIPIAHLLFVPLVRLTGDVRSGMCVQIAVLAIVSMAAILVARRVRGRTAIADAFFPILLMHTGNSFNLLMGFQIALVLPVALTCAIPMILAAGPPRLSSRQVLGLGACVLSLPLHGGAGVSQALPLAAWATAVGAAERSSARTMLKAGLATLALFALYFVGFRSSSGPVHSPNLGRTLEIALQNLSLAFGPAAEDAWPYSGLLVAIVGLATLALLASTFVRRPSERARASGFAASLAATVTLALSIGFGRGGAASNAGFATRYVTLTAPLLLASSFAWMRFGPERTRRFVPLLLFALGAISLARNVARGEEFGERHASIVRRLDAEVRRGSSIPEIAETLGEDLYPNLEGAEARLEALHLGRLPPFRGRPYEANDPPPHPAFESFRTKPRRIVPASPPLSRLVDGTRVALARPPCELWFAIPSGAKSVRGRFGILPDAVRHGRTSAVRFTVERIVEGERDEVLYERTLDPARREEDRGFQEVSVDLPEHGAGRLVLRTAIPSGIDPGSDPAANWAFWSDVEIR